MKRLILLMSDVRETGRSTFSEVLHGLLRQKGVPHLLAHTDGGRPEGLAPSAFLDSSLRLAQQDFIALLDEAPVVVVDVATGDTDAFLEFIERSELPELVAEMDGAIGLVLPVNADARTESGVVRAAEVFRDDADYVVLRHGSGPHAWKLPNAGRAMHYLGAVELQAPVLPEALLAGLRAMPASLPEVVARKVALPRAHQPLFAAWQIDYYAALESAGDLLWPAEAVASCPALPASRLPAAARGTRSGSANPVI